MKLFETAQKTFKRTVKQVANDIAEKPKFYQNICDLVDEISAVQKDRTLALDPETKEVLKDLKASLKASMAKFDKETYAIHGFTGAGKMNARQYNLAFHDFCKTSVDAIHQHQSTLMAAPGLWNKLKACINNVLEEYLGIKDALEIKDSNVALSGDFKSRFNDAKFEGKEKMELIEEKPFSPNI